MSEGASRFPWWVTDEAELARLPIGAPVSVDSFPSSSPWAWAVGTTIGTVVLHPRDPNRPHQVIHGWDRWVVAVGVDPSGERIAAVDQGGRLAIVEPRRNRTSPLPLGAGPVGRQSSLWSPGGDRVALVLGGEVVVVDAASDDTRAVAEDVLSAAWIGSDLVALSRFGVLAVLHDGTGRRRTRVLADDGTISVGATPSGLLTTGHVDGTISLRDVTEGGEAQVVTNVAFAPSRITWSWDGSALAAEGHGGEVRVTSVGPGARWGTSSPRGVAQVAWARDAPALATALHTGSVEVGHPDGSAGPVHLRGHSCGVRSAASLAGGGIAIGGYGRSGVRVFRPGPDGRPQPVPGLATGDPVRRLRRHPRYDHLVGLQLDGRIWVFDGEGRRSIGRTAGTDLDLSSSGAWAVTSGGGAQLAQLVRVDGRAGPAGPTWQGVAAACSPETGGIAVLRPPTGAGGEAGGVVIFDEDTFDATPVLDDGRPAAAVSWGPAPGGLAVAYSDGIDVHRERGVGVLAVPSWLGTVERMSWSPDGRTLVATSPTGGMAIWRDPAEGTAPVEVRNRRGVYDLTWLGEQRMVLCTPGGLVEVWDVLDDGHPQWVGSYVSWGEGVPAGDATVAPVEATGPEREPVLVAATHSTVLPYGATDDDRIDAVRIAHGLDDLLRIRLADAHRRPGAAKHGASMAVNVDAAWGRGKSTLIRLLLARVRPLVGPEPAWRVVHHDAWRHSRTSPSWWALAHDLRDAVAADRSWVGRLRLRARELAHRYRHSVGVGGTAAIAAATAVLALSLPWTPDYATRPWKTVPAALIGSVSGGVALGVLLVGAVAVARRFVHWGRRGGADALSSPASPLGQVAEHVEWLRRQAARSASGRRPRSGEEPRPILFVIDELDRCASEVVVEVLDSVHTLMRSGDPPAVPAADGARSRRRAPVPIAFVVLADAAWIRRAYEVAHEDQVVAEGTGVTLGAQFHAKLFDVVVALPPLTDRQHHDLALAQLERFEAARAVRSAGGTEDAATPRQGAPLPPPSPPTFTPPLRPPGPVDVGPGPGAFTSGDEWLVDEEVLGEGVVLGDDDIEEPEAESTMAATEELIEEGEHLVFQHRDLLPRNPRQMVRALNDWTISVLVQEAKEPHERPTDEEILRWAVVTQAWPDLAAALLTVPDLDRPDRLGWPALAEHLGRASRPGGPDLVELVASWPVRRVWPMVWADDDDRHGPAEGDPVWVEALAKLAGAYPPLGSPGVAGEG